MGSEDWQSVRKIFDAALRQEPEDRQNYLNKACGDDKELLSEVESLFSSFDKSGDFMETPAVAHVADIIEADAQGLEIGTRFGHYEIIRQIGIGGMGEVYLARDQKLDRRVAIKILNEKFSRDESNLKRFVREAKAASALNHPNILVIHEIGENEGVHYIVSEFIEGRTLREVLTQSQMSLGEVLDVAIQIAGALSVAHEAHLVHRDIKPENVMVRPDGYVKVLDFGLAKLVEQENKPLIGLEDGTIRNQTAKGVILGTVNYMSPEQAKGHELDEQTDIFSLGAVIYEMIARKTPFAGNTTADTFANLINAEPQPIAVSVPNKLKRIVDKTLRKKKDERYQTMKDVLADLKDLKENLTVEENRERSDSRNDNATAVSRAVWGGVNKQNGETPYGLSQKLRRHKPLAASALAALLIAAIGLAYYFAYSPKTVSSVGTKKSIAVLPLNPINTASRDDIYEIGIADSIIHRLSSMRGFVVRPLNATRQYRDLAQDPLSAGREQQVDYILQSNYQIVDGKIRVTAHLVNVANGEIQNTYQAEKDSADILKMQDAVALEIGNGLLKQFATTDDAQTSKRGTNNEEAYRLFLQGMYLANNRNREDALKSVAALEQAVSLDENYARAWAGLGYAHRTVSLYLSDATTRETYDKSIQAINKALLLEPNLSEAHSALCENKYLFEWDFAGAEQECKVAIQLDPNSSQAHEIYSRYLMGRGRHDEAIAEITTAIDLDPSSRFNQRNYGRALFYARRYAEAADQLKRVAAMDQNFLPTYSWLTAALAFQGKESEAYEWVRRFLSVLKANNETVQGFDKAFSGEGWRGVLREWSKLIDAGRSPLGSRIFDGALYHAQLGQKDKAFQYLEQVYQRREIWMTYLRVEPRLDPLRDDARFNDLLRRVESK